MNLKINLRELLYLCEWADRGYNKVYRTKQKAKKSGDMELLTEAEKDLQIAKETRSIVIGILNNIVANRRKEKNVITIEIEKWAAKAISL